MCLVFNFQIIQVSRVVNLSKNVREWEGFKLEGFDLQIIQVLRVVNKEWKSFKLEGSRTLLGLRKVWWSNDK